MKKFLKTLFAVSMLWTVVGVSTTTALANTNVHSGNQCAVNTNSGTNRSGVCGNRALVLGSRRAGVDFNHSQFSIATSTTHVNRGTHSSARATIIADNGVSRNGITISSASGVEEVHPL